MTATVWHPRPDVWVVKWSDGMLTLEACEADAEMCVKFPTLCHPDAWERMRKEGADALNG